MVMRTLSVVLVLVLSAASILSGTSQDFHQDGVCQSQSAFCSNEAETLEGDLVLGFDLSTPALNPQIQEFAGSARRACTFTFQNRVSVFHLALPPPVSLS